MTTFNPQPLNVPRGPTNVTLAFWPRAPLAATNGFLTLHLPCFGPNNHFPMTGQWFRDADGQPTHDCPEWNGRNP